MSAPTLPIRQPGSPRPPRRDTGRTIVRGIGELFITLGALLLLMCVYQLWWTNVESAQAIAAGRDEITAGWRDQGSLPVAPNPNPNPTASGTASPRAAATPTYGSGFALLYIPAMRDKVWGLPVSQGTGKDVLARGAGHYKNTALPGEVGNFALAAHRSTHNEPFANVDDLRVGDKVYVQTREAWFTYTLQKDDSTLTPRDVWVIQPVPGQPGVTPTKKLITLTTCTPRYGSTGRWAWWGELSDTRPAAEGPPDGLVGTA